MSKRTSPAFLQYLARWDRDETVLLDTLEAVAGHPVDFAGGSVPTGARTLFSLFERDPLDAVTQERDGSWLLPFHPYSAYRAIVEERYLGPAKAPLHARLPFPYQLVPGPLRLALYPLVAGKAPADPEACPPDPAWPIESRIDLFRAALFDGIAEESSRFTRILSREDEARARGPWPGGRYPLIVTHDIDTKEGMKAAGPILDDMLRLGLRPCFFLVGRGYEWDRGFCEAVTSSGGEIALHGDRHDNRIAFLSEAKACRRLDACSRQIELFGVRGFRSPSLLVSDSLYRALEPRFEWDSSVPDTDTHTLIGPRRGCGTIFPFRREGLLVLPTTLPADDRLELLGYKGMELLAVLRRKWRWCADLGGLCHFLTHAEPHLFGRAVLRDLYRALFQEILDEGDAWVATPSMVADAWRDIEAGADWSQEDPGRGGTKRDGGAPSARP